MKARLLIASVVAFGIGTPALASKLFDLPPEVKRLEFLHGTWKGTGTLSNGTQALAFSARWSCERAAAGWGVSCSLSAQIPGTGQYDATDMFGYDVSTRDIHWFSTTSLGESHDHVGTWVGTDTLRFQYIASRGDKRFVEKITVRWLGPRDLEVETVTELDGKPGVRTVLKLKK